MSGDHSCIIDANCVQCDDYLHMIDWHERMRCPICFEMAAYKRDAAIDLLKQINANTQDEALKAKIKKVLDLREW